MRDILGKIHMDGAAYAKAELCQANTAFWLRMVLVTPGFQFVLSHRLQEMIVRLPLIGRALRRLLWWLTCLIFGSEIAMAATIGGGLYIPHPYGIVVGRSTVGRRVSILQNVTIGTKRVEDRTVPVIEDGVTLGAGCAVLGQVVIGADSAVGANSVVLNDLPAGSVAVGVPARIINAPHGQFSPTD